MRAMAGECAPRCEDSRTVASSLREATWIREVRVHVPRRRNAVEHKHDLAVRRDPVAVDDDAQAPGVNLEARPPAEADRRRRLKAGDPIDADRNVIEVNAAAVRVAEGHQAPELSAAPWPRHLSPASAGGAGA